LKKTRDLSEIHYKLNRIKAPENLLNLKAQLKKHIEKSEYITSDIKNFVYDLLNQLPDGDRLCHGDFHTPRMHGSSWLSFKILNLAGLLSAKTYFKEYQRKQQIDLDQFSKWLPVRAAERTYIGMQSERESLQKFILKCKKDYNKQKVNLNWHNFI